MHEWKSAEPRRITGLWKSLRSRIIRSLSEPRPIRNLNPDQTMPIRCSADLWRRLWSGKQECNPFSLTCECFAITEKIMIGQKGRMLWERSEEIHMPKRVIQGLYRPQFEHDNCGIGAVVSIRGEKSHKAVTVL